MKDQNMSKLIEELKECLLHRVEGLNDYCEVPVESISEVISVLESKDPLHVSKETAIRISKEVSAKFMENNKILRKLRGGEHE